MMMMMMKRRRNDVDNNDKDIHTTPLLLSCMMWPPSPDLYASLQETRAAIRKKSSINIFFNEYTYWAAKNRSHLIVDCGSKLFGRT